MPTTSRLPLREKALPIAFGIYAVLSLISMATQSIGAGILALAILGSPNILTRIKAEWSKPVSRNFVLASMALTASVFLSLIGAKFFPLNYGETTPTFMLLGMSKCWYFFWPFLVVVGLRQLSIDQRNRILKIWMGAFLVLSVIGAAQYFTCWPRWQGIPGHGLRCHATLFLGHHLSVASIWIFPLFFALDQAWLNLRTRNVFGWAVICVFATITLVFTFSRTLWVALPFGLFVWTLLKLPRKYAVFLILLFGLGGIAAYHYEPIHRRLTYAQGIGSREALWEANVAFFKHRPLTGVGFRRNQDLSGHYLMEKLHTKDVFAGHAHNNFLDMLGGTGLIGVVAWLFWCTLALWITGRAKSPDISMMSSAKVGLTCAWIVFHLNGLTQVNFWEGKVQHQIAWVLAWAML